MRILGALEKLEIATDDKEVGDDSFLRILNEVSETEDDVRVEEEQVMEDETIVEEVEDAVESLVAIAKVIKAHGLSKPVMLAADPKGSFTAAGIVGSYEELEEEPVKGEESEQVVENITKRLKSANGHMKKLNRQMATKLKSWNNVISRRNQLSKKALKMASGVMEETPLTETEIDEVEVSATEYASFKQATLTTSKMIRALNEAETEEQVEEVENEINEETLPATENSALKKLGWNKATLKEAIRMSEEVEEEVSKVEEASSEMIKKMEEEVVKVEEAGDSDVAETETALRLSIRKQKLVRMVIARARFLTGMVLKLTQKTCRSKKAKK